MTNTTRALLLLVYLLPAKVRAEEPMVVRTREELKDLTTIRTDDVTLVCERFDLRHETRFAATAIVSGSGQIDFTLSLTANANQWELVKERDIVILVDGDRWIVTVETGGKGISQNVVREWAHWQLTLAQATRLAKAKRIQWKISHYQCELDGEARDAFLAVYKATQIAADTSVNSVVNNEPPERPGKGRVQHR